MSWWLTELLKQGILGFSQAMLLIQAIFIMVPAPVGYGQKDIMLLTAMHSVRLMVLVITQLFMEKIILLVTVNL